MSYGKACIPGEYNECPGLYLRVSAELDWILQGGTELKKATDGNIDGMADTSRRPTIFSLAINLCFTNIDTYQASHCELNPPTNEVAAAE